MDQTKIAGVLTNQRGYQYAWALRKLPQTEKFDESILFEVTSLSQKVPTRVITLRGANLDDIKGLLLAFIHELD